ncbi:MAG: hypothetical protein ACTJHW_09055 [Paenalcaligenes sp.]
MVRKVYLKWRYAVCGAVVACMWVMPAQAQWRTPLQHIEKVLGLYKTEALIAVKSEALWYHAWQVEGVDIPILMQRLQEQYAELDRIFVQMHEVVWESSASVNPCALRLQKIATTQAFLSLSCMRSQQPVHQPLLSHPALQLLWAWKEKLADSVVEHQWYSVQKGVEPQSVLQTLLSQKFPAMSIHSDQHALSFQRGAEQWLLTWVQLGELMGVYVLRWQ